MIRTANCRSAFWGGSGEDEGYGIAVDVAGNACLTGSTASVDFPTTPGAFQTVSGENLSSWNPDAFVTKINSQGDAVLYSGYLGGGGSDRGGAIAIDESGNAYVTGVTGSPDFPLVRSIKSSLAGSGCFFGGCYDAFISRINAAGSAVTFSSYLGGGSFDYVNAIAVDPPGNVYLTGSTGADFPITSGVVETAPREIFITKIADSPLSVQIAANPQSGGGPLTVRFEGSALSESGAAVSSYHWDFGDGTTGTGPVVDHTYTDLGGYTVLLTVTDSDGKKGSAHANIEVSDFTLRIDPEIGNVVPGDSAMSTVFIGGGPITVNLSCSAPSAAGLACVMDPSSVTPRIPEGRNDPGATSTLTVTTFDSIPVGSYPITVTGRSGGALDQVTFTLNVRPGDNFNQPNGTHLGPDWDEVLPDLEIYNGQIRNADAGSKAAIFNWPIGPDQEVSADCKVTAAGNACGVMARWSNSANFYHARIDVGQLNLVLFKTVNGVTTELGRAELPEIYTRFDNYYNLRLVVRGNSVTAAAIIPGEPPTDGCCAQDVYTPTVTVTDGSLTAGDYAGIRAFASAPHAVWFENFFLTKPGASLPGGVLFTDEFNRTGGLGLNWKITAGSYTTDGTFALSGAAANWAHITKSLGTNDYTVESALIIPAGSLYSGIVARGNPSAFSSDLYAAQLSSKGSVNLYRRNGGTWTLLKSAASGIVAGRPYKLALKVSGSSPVNLEVSLDGSPLFNYQDGAGGSGDRKL